LARAKLQELFEARVERVRSREFPYLPKRPHRRDWSSYDAAQENEFPEVIGLIGSIIGKASESFRLAPSFDAIGREPYSKRDVARLLLAQQYDGRCNRVSIGLLSLLKAHLGIRGTFHPTYKTLERAYEDPDVISLLNEAFFLTQLPVKDLERDFAMDGTCHPTTIKQNWESSKDEILRLNERKKRAGAKERKRHEFEKTVLAVGTTFKIIASFARTRSPFSNESPYLRPLLDQVVELYAMVAKVSVDSGLLSRENCTLIEKAGALPRMFPKKNSSIKTKGSAAWRKMMLEFIEDTQAWLREYHSRSIVETVNSTLKRLFVVPLRKRLVERKATELLARIVVYNIRQLVYLKYTKGIEIDIQSIPKHVTLMNWMAP
jgi:transposase